MKHILVRALVYLLAIFPLTACGTGKAELSSGPISGQILEAPTKKPIAGAIVLVRWQGVYSQVVDTKTACYHVETATTDAEGRYQTAPWKEPTRGSAFSLGPRMIDAYKAGYESHWPPGFDRTQDYKQNIYYLAPFKGAREERLKYLERMLEATRCGSQNESERNLYALFHAMYEEAKTIAATKEGEEIVDTLRYWASFVILDKNKPVTRDVKGRLINIDLKGQQK